MQTQFDGDSTEQQPHNSSNGSLSVYFEIIIKYRKFIGAVVGTVFVLSIIISLLLPKMFIATARVLPPREANPGISALLTGSENPLSGLTGSLIGNPTPAALYVGIMKSRSTADELNRKFNLKELYGLTYVEDVYSILQDRSTIEISKKDKLIHVSVRDRDPQRAADMANTYVAMLDQINRKLNVTQGKRKRLFLEDRLKQVRATMEKAEINLKTFQETYHLVSIEEQAKAAIEGASEIKGEIIAAQTKLEVLKQFGTERQIEAVMLKAQIEELQKQLNSIEQGQKLDDGASDASGAVKKSNLYIPFDDLPRLGMQMMGLMREAKIQEKLFELLTAQYEMARIEEAKDMDTIQVLDPAVPPEKRSGPNRRAIVFSSVMIATMVALFLAFLIEYSGGFQMVTTQWPTIKNRLSQFITRRKAHK